MNIQEHTIHKMFEAQVEEIPANTAVIFSDQLLTYSELNAKTNQLAGYLRELGVNPDTQVAVCLERSIDLLITTLGILKAGGAYVPLDSSHPDERLLSTLNDCCAPILIIQANIKDKFVQYKGKLIVLDEDTQQINTHSICNPSAVAGPDHLAYIIYTSGSTGKPKGVLIEHKSVVNYCRWFAEYCGCQPLQRIDFSSNHTFDMAITTLLVPLMLGLTIVICNDDIKKSPLDYLDYLDDNQVNIVKMTPSYFKILLEEVNSNIIALPHLQNIILGGERLATVDCLSWLGMYPEHNLFNEYGPTEATVGVSQYKICHANVSSLTTNVPIGTPGPNMHCYILDPDNAQVSDGEIGELHIGGLCLARGYLNHDELTAQLFITLSFGGDKNIRLYKTGDLCRSLPDGIIEYIGRIDEQVKIRGFRIEPGEIEHYLATYPTIKKAVVHAREENLSENQLIAYYILKDRNAVPTVHQLREYLQIHLPDYMIPAAFVKLDAFPLNANGKLDRSALPVQQFITSQHYQPPCTDLEKTLTELWSEELGIKLIGLNDNFFELGGHSLSAARIISRIHNVLNKHVPLQDFYHATTISTLATVVESIPNTVEDNGEEHTILHHNSPLLPLSDFQFLLWISNTFEPKANKLNIVTRKRMQGRLDRAALTFAFESVMKKHDVLFYRVLKFRPAQIVQKNLPFNMVEKNLESLSEHDTELALESSIEELIYHYPWQKDAPMLIARLFNLKNQTSELQICMPHIMSDNVFPEIILFDLSTFYLLYQSQTKIDFLHAKIQYKEYILNEQHYFHTNLERDLIFWENYLKDASLFEFPEKFVVHDMQSKQYAYSTYHEIPTLSLKKLQQFCAKHHVNIKDGLCAAVGLALFNCCDEHYGKQPVFMSIVKSTRDNHLYDETIGCFLRLEPIKVYLNTASTLTTLSKEVHQSAVDTNPHQRCSSMVKLASIGAFRLKRKIFKEYVVSLFTFLYTSIVRKPKLNRKILNLGARLSPIQHNNDFIININVQSNFISPNKRKNESNLFGLTVKNIKIYQYDLLNIDHFFDVCFLRDDGENKAYIVISANLEPAFREQIAKEVTRIISFNTLVRKQTTENKVF